MTFALYPSIAPRFLRGELKEEPLEPPEEEKTPKKELSIPTHYHVEIDGDEYEVKVIPTGYIPHEELEKPMPPKKVEGGVVSTVRGMVTKLKVKEGDKVKKGDVVAVIEAMKMENDIQAPRTGVVEKIFVEEGDNVEPGDTLMTIK